MGLDIFYIILGIIIVLVFGFVYKNKTKIKIKIPKFSKKPRGASTSTNTTNKSNRDKVEIVNIISTVFIIIVIIAATLWVASWFRGCGRENKSNNTEKNYHNPSRHQTTTTYIATKSGKRVYMETAYWSLKPMGKLKIVSPDGSIFYDEPGEQNEAHYSAGWYTFYPVEEENVTFYVTQ